MSGLHLSRLTLSHFRSHRHAVIETDVRPVAIFGPNGAGKTNILEAISLFSPGRGLRRASAQDMSRRPESLGWKLSGELHSGQQLHEVEISALADGARQTRIDEKAAPQLALARLTRVLWLVPAMDRLWIEGADGRRRFLDRMTMSFLPSHGDAVLLYEKAMRERNRLLKDQVRDPAWYDAIETQMARAGREINVARQDALTRLSAAQMNATTAFPTAELELCNAGDPIGETEDDLRDALARHRARDLTAGRSLFGPHRADLKAVYQTKGVDARECSTGEQKALLISLILANARALKEELSMPPLLLLDEVAAHLDADRRAALYDEITALGAQAWMTGTEMSLFQDLGPRAQYLEVLDEDGQSKVRVP